MEHCQARIGNYFQALRASPMQGTVQFMPQAVQADWGLIQALYQKGLTPTEIAKQTGVKADTVSGRAFRGGWRKALFAAREIVKSIEVTGKAMPASESKSQARSERVRAGLAAVLERSVDKLASMPIPTHKVALRVNGELESVVRNAKTVFGWTENQTAPAIRIGVLAQVTIQPASAPEPSQSQPVIEVESTPVSVTEVGPIHDKS